MVLVEEGTTTFDELQPLVMLMLLGTESLDDVTGSGAFRGRMTTGVVVIILGEPHDVRDDVRDDDFMTATCPCWR